MLILSFLLVTVSAGTKEKKTTLEDIERDYISNERKTKLSPVPPTTPKITSPAQSPTRFGFIPRKTIANYARQEHQPTYVQPQYIEQYVQQQPVDDYSQYATAQQYNPSTTPHRYSIDTQYTVPQYSGSPQKYTPQISRQEAYNYVSQSPNQLQSLENVQYVTDNSINTPTASQYYTPQYIYLQQYSAPSTAVQTVVEPKGKFMNVESSKYFS